MDTSRTPDSDDRSQPKPAGPESALPPSYTFAPRNRETSILPIAPPAYVVNDDWLILIPHYRRYLPVKMALGVISFAVSAAVIGLTKAHGDQSATYRNPDVPARSDSLTYGAATLAMIWVFFEFLVLFSYKYKTGRRGIHPGGHILFDATIFAVAIVSAVGNIRFLESDSGGYFQPETPPEERARLHELLKAISATVLTVGAIHFVLFCVACVDTSFINSGKHNARPIPLATMPRAHPGTETIASPTFPAEPSPAQFPSERPVGSS